MLERRYNLTMISGSKKCIWFRIAKTGTRTVFRVLRESDVIFEIENGRNLPLPDGDYFSFTFVRNPYSRIISAWTDKILNRGKGGGIERVTFPERLRNFDYFIDWVTDQNPFDINIHYRPQTLLVPYEVDFMGRTEKFESDLQYLMSILKIDRSRNIPRANMSGSERFSPRGISKSSLSKINAFYFQDFERFDYSMMER